MSWEPIRNNINAGAVNIRWGTTTVPGVFSVEVTVHDIGMPLGFVWYRFACGNQLEIAYIWVHEDCRRCGLADRMLNQLLTTYDRLHCVATGQCNEMSKPWCIKNGFTFDESRNYWVKLLAKPKAARTSKTRPKAKGAIK